MHTGGAREGATPLNREYTRGPLQENKIIIIVIKSKMVIEEALMHGL